MIALCLAKIELPSKIQALLRDLALDVDNRKLEAWKQQKPRLAESISGVLLLQRGLKIVGISPQGEALRYEPNGRPYLQSGRAEFNISHTVGVAACAIRTGTDCRVGVDVERLQGRSALSMQRIADRWFTEAERSWFRETPDEACFLRIWTGKEALAKRTGVGLGGLAGCDVTKPPKDVKLKIYQWEAGIVSLCYPATETAPAEIMWIEL